MKNKVLIKLVVPTLMEEYEMFIPVNERIIKIKKLILESLKSLSDNLFDDTKGYSLIDPETGQIYKNDEIVRETNIKNSKKIVLI